LAIIESNPASHRFYLRHLHWHSSTAKPELSLSPQLLKFNGRKLTNSNLYCELPLGLITDDDRPVVAIDIPNMANQPRIRSIIDVLSYADDLRS